MFEFTFGHKIVESIEKLANFDSVCMPRTENSFINSYGCAVKTWCRCLRSMLDFFRRVEDEAWIGVKKIEVSIGVDHGKCSNFL